MGPATHERIATLGNDVGQVVRCHRICMVCGIDLPCRRSFIWMDDSRRVRIHQFAHFSLDRYFAPCSQHRS